MSYQPLKKLTNFDKRISAFIDVETYYEKKKKKRHKEFPFSSFDKIKVS